MSVTSQIQLLIANKAAIKTAIEAKNPVTSPTDELAQWPISIASIQGSKAEQTKTATPTAAGFTVVPDLGNTLSAVVINGDADLVAGNIKNGVEIFGVTGSYEGSGGGGLQGYNLSVNTHEGDFSFTIYYPDGTSSNVTAPRDTTTTFTNVAYFKSSINIGNSFSPYHDSYVLLLSDTTIYVDFGCILKGSLVNLWNGTTKKIEDITYDDEILCWDFDNGKYASAKPFWIKQAQHNTIYWLNRFQSGKEIKTTGTVAGHRFFDMDKGKFLYNTECVGDLCYTKDGLDRLVEAVKIEEECEFYNVYMYYHMNMFVNGILTGFRYNNLYPISDMKFVKDNRTLRPREEFTGVPDAWFYGMRCAEQLDSADKIRSYAVERELIRK